MGRMSSPLRLWRKSQRNRVHIAHVWSNPRPMLVFLRPTNQPRNRHEYHSLNHFKRMFISGFNILTQVFRLVLAFPRPADSFRVGRFFLWFNFPRDRICIVLEMSGCLIIIMYRSSYAVVSSLILCVEIDDIGLGNYTRTHHGKSGISKTWNNTFSNQNDM